MKVEKNSVPEETKNRKKRISKGFSLMELMVVIIILGLLAAVVLPELTGKSEQAKRKLVCIQMKNISESVKMFKLDNGRYPDNEEGLQALVENPDPEELKSYPRGGYVEDGKLPLDSWKHDYIYIYEEGDEQNSFDIISLGADGKEGGSGDNEDIYYSKCN